MNEKIRLFLSGFITSALLFVFAGYFLVIQPSISRDSEYKKQYQQLTNINRQLADSIRDRETNIKGLQYISNRLAESNRLFNNNIREREEIIKRARDSISSANDSLSKLESILLAFQKLEQIWVSGNNH